MPRKSRKPEPAPDAEGDLASAFAGLVDVPKETAVEEPEAQPQETVPKGTVDDYIRRQVTLETYGTENPSDYDKIQAAIRRML